MMRNRSSLIFFEGASSKLPLSPQGPKGPPPKPPPRPVRGHTRSASLDLNTIAPIRPETAPSGGGTITTTAAIVHNSAAVPAPQHYGALERCDAETQTGDDRTERDSEQLMDFGAELG